MNKKTLTIVISIICFLLFATVVVANLIKNGIISTENFYHSVDSNNNDTHYEKEQNNENKGINGKYPIFKVRLSEGVEFPVQYADGTHKKNEYSDIVVKYNSVYISKEKGDFDICGDFKEIKDENGNIINEYSYVTVNASIINKGKNVFSSSLNNIYLSLGLHLLELRSYNSEKTSHSKDYYIIGFEPNVEYNYNLVFIVEDSLIEEYRNELYLYVSFYNNSDRLGEGNNIPLVKKSEED